MKNEKRPQSDKPMNFEGFYGHYIEKYLPLYWLFSPSCGYIVWRFGTGENVELLHVRSFASGQGIGTRLVKAMLRELQKNKPYYSVFGFTLASNAKARRWYHGMGFNTQECGGPYKGDPSVMFSQSFDVLCVKLLTGDDGDPDLMKDAVKSKNLQ